MALTVVHLACFSYTRPCLRCISFSWSLGLFVICCQRSRIVVVFPTEHQKDWEPYSLLLYSTIVKPLNIRLDIWFRHPSALGCNGKTQTEISIVRQTPWGICQGCCGSKHPLTRFVDWQSSRVRSRVRSTCSHYSWVWPVLSACHIFTFKM